MSVKLDQRRRDDQQVDDTILSQPLQQQLVRHGNVAGVPLAIDDDEGPRVAVDVLESLLNRVPKLRSWFIPQPAKLADSIWRQAKVGKACIKLILPSTVGKESLPIPRRPQQLPVRQRFQARSAPAAYPYGRQRH